MWVGDKDGRIIVMATDGLSREREFNCHEVIVNLTGVTRPLTLANHPRLSPVLNT